MIVVMLCTHADEMMERNRDKKIGLATNLPTARLAGFCFIVCGKVNKRHRYIVLMRVTFDYFGL